MPRKRRGSLILGGFLLLALGFCALTSPGRAAARAVLLLSHLLPDFPVRPLQIFTPPPLSEEIDYPAADGETRAIIYRPGDWGVHPAVILLFGLAPDFAHPRVVSLAEGLARSGFVVMLPDPPGMREGRLSVEDIQALVAAFQYLENQPYVRGDKIGYGGFSLGASLSLVAAAEESISRRVAYVNFFGGYYDAYDLLQAVTTRTAEEDGKRVPWEPHPEMVDFVQGVFLKSLESEKDINILYGAWYGGEAIDPDPLSPAGRAIYQLMANRNPQQFAELYSRLPQEMRDNFQQTSPHYSLDSVQAPVFIMHDRGDTYVPVGESRRLAEALPQAQYTEFAFFQHVVPQNPGNLWAYLGEFWKLWGHLHRLLLVAG